ncbi:MAG TPA: M48 family metalloprotease [Thermomicrobiales bacterium]|nr:M48 family metalloprotease [Thermomicrobiales bacterium]
MGARLTAIRQMFLLEAVIAAPLMAGGFLVAGSRGVVGGLLVALLIETVAWFCSRPILVRICSATPVADGEYPQLVAAVCRIADLAGITTPQVAVSTLPIPNAMAAVTPGGGLVCVTEGLLGMLSPAELEAVLAHEIAHLTEPGRAGATIAALFASIPGAITAAAGSDLYFELPYRRAQMRVWGGGRMHPLRDLIARLTAPIAAILVRISTSPASEYAADERAARIIDDPAALALALRKLQSLAGRIVWPVNPAIAHLLVIHPFGCPKLGQLFNTHPATPDRLATLIDSTR